jgi:hypothetical protein
MNQIIQNIKEYSTKSFDLVLANKALSIGIAAFVVLSILGGLYLYSSYSRSEIKQMEIVEASIASRISEVLTKMSFAQKLSSVLTVPLLAIAYKLYTTVEPLAEFVYRMRTEVPTRLQIILFCTFTKWVLIGVIALLSIFPFETVPVKPVDATEIRVSPVRGDDLPWYTKAYSILINVIPFFIKRFVLAVNVVYNLTYKLCGFIIRVQQNYFQYLAIITLIASIIYFLKIPYLYDFGAFVRYYLSWDLTNFGFFSKFFVPLCVNTYEDKYLFEELISSKLVKSEVVYFPWTSVSSLE